MENSFKKLFVNLSCDEFVFTVQNKPFGRQDVLDQQVQRFIIETGKRLIQNIL